MEFHLPLHISPRILKLSKQIETYCLKKDTRKSLVVTNKKTKQTLINSFLSMESKTEIPTEMENALAIYPHLKKWDPLSLRDFKKAHHLLMRGIDKQRGQWRKTQVVVKEGNRITHRPPAAREVPALMQQLFRDIRRARHLSWLIRACVLHYGVMYIHPFVNGNGRIGRIWQHLLMLKQSQLFQTVQISTIIQKNEMSYYKALDRSDAKQDGGVFVEFCLEKILRALR